MARGAAKIVSINGPLTVTFTAASGATPAVFSDEACTTTVALPATVSDGANTTFYFASPGSYTLSVKTSGGIQIAGDLNSTKVVTVSAGDVGVYAYDTRLVARDASGDSGRHSPNTDLSAAYVTPRRLTVAFIGDSGFANGSDWVSTPGFQSRSAQGPWVWAHVLNGGRWDVTPRDAIRETFAVAGYTTAQMLADNLHGLAAASAADVVVIEGPLNDCVNGISAATTLTNLQTMWTTLRAAGKIVVQCTAWQRNNSGTDTGTTRDQLRDQNFRTRAAVQGQQGIYLCDWYSINTDPSTSLPTAGFLNSDLVHPNCTGGSRLGAVLAGVLDQLFPQASPLYLDIDDADVRAVNANGFMLGNTAGVATSWSAITKGTPTSITPTKVARTDNRPGEWQQVVVVAATADTDGVQMRTVVNSGGKWSPGDTLVAAVEFQTDATSWDCRAFYATLTGNGTTNGAQTAAVSASQLTAQTTPLYRPASGVFVTPPMVAPASGMTNAQLSVFFYGSGTFRMGRSRIYKTAP